MTVHVLVPVHNRLAQTRTIIECIRRQKLDEPISIVIIDDGSTDGTAEFLSRQPDMVVLAGNGNLWWGGAIQLGLDHVARTAAMHDWVVFLNNDTTIADDFIATLLEVARSHAPAAVGCVVRGSADGGQVLSIGPGLDAWRLRTWDRVEDQSRFCTSDWSDIDALSGRGVLYPLSALVGRRARSAPLLPHYLADYDLSLRVQKQGYRLLVSHRAAVISRDDFSARRPARTFRQRYFGIDSPTYLPSFASFWWRASTPLQRLTLPFRALLFMLFPATRSDTRRRNASPRIPKPS